MKLPTMRPLDSPSCRHSGRASQATKGDFLLWIGTRPQMVGSSHSGIITSEIFVVHAKYDSNGFDLQAWAPCNRVLPSQCSACMASMSTTPPAKALKLGKWSKCKNQKTCASFFETAADTHATSIIVLLMPIIKIKRQFLVMIILEVHKPYHLYANDMSHNRIWSLVNHHHKHVAPGCTALRLFAPRTASKRSALEFLEPWTTATFFDSGMKLSKDVYGIQLRQDNGSTQLICV